MFELQQTPSQRLDTLCLCLLSLGHKKAVSYKGGLGECTLVPVFVPGEHANVPLFRFSFRGNIGMYPRSGFRSGGTSAKPSFWKTTLLSTPYFLTEEKLQEQNNQETLWCKRLMAAPCQNQLTQLLVVFTDINTQEIRIGTALEAIASQDLLEEPTLLEPTC